MSSNHEIQVPKFPVLVPTLQISFYSKLADSQSEYLLPALLSTVASLDIVKLDQELALYAGNEKLQQLGRQGLRAELVFPTPYLLTQKPSLLGYYRLLFGFSQKEFYNGRAFGIFVNMETANTISQRARALLPALCTSLIESAWILVKGIPTLSHDILQALTLLTYGGQLRGSYNTQLGQRASKIVFDKIRETVAQAIESEDSISISLRNAAGRLVRIEFAPDPDIAIREQLGSGKFKNRIAIEIKGGKDFSNIHNRLGEAEKSHQKAKVEGFNQFWTMVNVDRLDLGLARRESPTTTAFFSIGKIVVSDTPEENEFRELLLAELGLKGDA